MPQVLIILFCRQVLFKNLSVDMKDITPTSLLKDRRREIEGNPDFSNKDVVPQSQVVAEVKSAVISPPNDFVPDIVNPVSHSHINHVCVHSVFNFFPCYYFIILKLICCFF